jgi:hypothetical protein
MYKWHLQSALRSSRPVANDLKIVTDGIAASLRQFSVSAQRAEEGMFGLSSHCSWSDSLEDGC